MSAAKKSAGSIKIDASDDPLVTIRINKGDHTPSWLRPGQSSKGFAEFSARAHKRGGWLSISLLEGATLPSGRGTEKRTMLDLDAADVAALRAMLDFAFPRESGK